MILSMTGFGKAVVEAVDKETGKETGKKITVEIKSLNSKQMDLNVRMPNIYREKELEMRTIVTKNLERGKVDMLVSVESTCEASTATINAAAVKAYVAQIRHTCEEMNIAEPVDWASVLLRLPDVLHTEVGSGEVPAEDAQALKEGVEKAVEALMQYRRTEGKKLEEFFAIRINNITAYLSEVETMERERVEKIYHRIEDGLSKIPEVEYDKGRLEQEMIYYIEKLDVSEEKQRLAQHLRYFMETMSQPNPGQGKKLGFIAQEMGREINTLGSKSNHAEMQCVVVKMKDELEQIKEQVLNVM